MIADFAWIRPEPHGIHVVPANCWIDPSRPVDNALVTHGHADHARGGHGRTVATPETLAIMELRYQTREGALPVQYGETIRLPGEVDVTYVPAGHVLGSAQIVLEHKGERAYADAMGCTWMSSAEARKAVPPAYTQWIATQYLTHARTEVAA